MSPKSPFREGCHVSLQALLCLHTQQVFSPGRADRTHSNPQSNRSPPPYTHLALLLRVCFFWGGGFTELMLRVNFLHVSFSPSFSFFFFFQVPIYLNSFPLFFFLLHWFPNPCLCVQLGPSCVSVTACVCAYVCVCAHAVVWVFSGTVLPHRT